MILSSYERAGSPFIHIQYVAVPGAKKRFIKTRIRKDDPEKALKVAKELNKVEGRLLAAATTPAEASSPAESWSWVANYLRQRYASRPATADQYRVRWNWLAHFLVEHAVRSPGALERAHCFDYLDWRRAQVKEKSRRNPSLNTALSEIKLLGLVMDEAVARGLATENPARKLGVERDAPRERSAMTDEEIEKIYAELKSEPEWMQKAFHIALHTGLRHATTRIRREHVRLDRREIDIPNPKGGRRKAFSIPLGKAIEPMIRAFMASRRAVLWEVPEGILTGLSWTKFFRKIGLPHLDFHSTRRTFISRGALGGIPESVMMKLVNHASQEIHRIYQKFVAADLHAYEARIALPGPV
jgi:integrase